MSKVDEAKNAADLVGGWENLARGLYQLQTTGKNTFLENAIKRTKLSRLAFLFNPKKRGAPKKYDLDWFFMVEKIQTDAQERNKSEIEKTIIDKNLNQICGETLTKNKKRDEANKNIRNALGIFRKEIKKRSAKFDLSTDLGIEFLKWYEEPPNGFEYVDNKRDYD